MPDVKTLIESVASGNMTLQQAMSEVVPIGQRSRVRMRTVGKTAASRRRQKLAKKRMKSAKAKAALARGLKKFRRSAAGKKLARQIGKFNAQHSSYDDKSLQLRVESVLPLLKYIGECTSTLTEFATETFFNEDVEMVQAFDDSIIADIQELASLQLGAVKALSDTTLDVEYLVNRVDEVMEDYFEIAEVED